MSKQKIHIATDPGSTKTFSQDQGQLWWAHSRFRAVVQSLSGIRLFGTPRTAARQASLSFTISQRLLKLLSIKLVMPSNHLILCHPLLLLTSLFPSIRVFSNESALCIRWPNSMHITLTHGSENHDLRASCLILYIKFYWNTADPFSYILSLLLWHFAEQASWALCTLHWTWLGHLADLSCCLHFS